MKFSDALWGLCLTLLVTFCAWWVAEWFGPEDNIFVGGVTSLTFLFVYLSVFVPDVAPSVSKWFIIPAGITCICYHFLWEYVRYGTYILAAGIYIAIHMYMHELAKKKKFESDN